MKINKTHSQNGKKYSVIIKAEENIVEDKEYPAIFKEVKMSNKAPAWFLAWSKNFDNEISGIKKDILDIKNDIVNIKQDIVNIKQDIVNIKQDIVAIKNCPTIKRELKLAK